MTEDECKWYRGYIAGLLKMTIQPLEEVQRVMSIVGKSAHCSYDKMAEIQNTVIDVTMALKMTMRSVSAERVGT